MREFVIPIKQIKSVIVPEVNSDDLKLDDGLHTSIVDLAKLQIHKYNTQTKNSIDEMISKLEQENLRLKASYIKDLNET